MKVKEGRRAGGGVTRAREAVKGRVYCAHTPTLKRRKSLRPGEKC